MYSQYHFFDIYQNSRYADFVLENGSRRVAFEIDDEASHNKSLVASGKFYDDLLKQNSMVYLGWEVYVGRCGKCSSSERRLRMSCGYF